MAKEFTVFWFRRDLRFEDNCGLFHALRQSEAVLPLFIFDKEILDELEDPHDARVAFIYDQVRKIKHQMKAAGSDILVEHGRPLDVFKRLLDEFDVKAIYCNRDYEPYAISRDDEIKQLAATRGIEFLSFKDHLIFEGGEILTDEGSPYKVFTPYKRKWQQAFSEDMVKPTPSEEYMGRFQKEVTWTMPQLEELGFGHSNIVIPSSDFDLPLIARYEQDRDAPGKAGTTRLGIHLRHGTVSVRAAIRASLGRSDVWLNELIWREFYAAVLYNFPYVVSGAFKKKYDLVPWRDDVEALELWQSGRTGYPIVDAGMRQLNETGFMHNRVRMITASFLTKHLLLDRRLGEAYFAEKLLDFELASNNGGWQWAAGTGTDAQPYFRVFNPTAQMERFDPHLAYVKTWVPEHGTDAYPKPMVDHKFARERAINTYKEALV